MPIEGAVTLDGQPVESGTIAFYPVSDGEAGGVLALIESGKYALPADQGPLPGTFRVEVSWPKKTGRQIPSLDPGMMAEEMVEAIPAKYNRESQLRVEITSGQSTYDFHLESS